MTVPPRPDHGSGRQDSGRLDSGRQDSGRLDIGPRGRAEPGIGTAGNITT